MPKLSLKNQLLVSMPQCTSPTFHRTVSLIVQHDEDGAVGVIINRLTEHSLGEIFVQLSIPLANLECTDIPVFDGGPVKPELGTIIHAGRGNNNWESTLKIGKNLWLTSSRDILHAIAAGRGPEQAILILGYAGWGAGQLEAEMQQNAWFHTPADHSIIFDTEIAQKWQQAAELVGVDTARLSTQIGHA